MMFDDKYETFIIPLLCPPVIVLLTVNSEFVPMTYAVSVWMAGTSSGFESRCRKKVSGSVIPHPQLFFCPGGKNAAVSREDRLI